MLAGLPIRRDHIEGDPAEFPCSDLPLHQEEAEIGELLDGRLLRAHHATRLLPHEVDMICEHGMRRLDLALVTEKLDAARQHGHLTDGERSTLIAGLSLGSNRVGTVCLFLSRSAFDLQNARQVAAERWVEVEHKTNAEVPVCSVAHCSAERSAGVQSSAADRLDDPRARDHTG